MHRSDFWNRNEPIEKVRGRKAWEILQKCIASVIITGAFLLSPAVPAWAQSSFEKARTILKSGLSNRKADQRVLATRVLGLLEGNTQAEELALTALEDPKPEVRAAAAEAVGQMKAKSAVPKLVETLKKEQDVSVVMAGARSLIALGDPLGYTVYLCRADWQKKEWRIPVR